MYIKTVRSVSSLGYTVADLGGARGHLPPFLLPPFCFLRGTPLLQVQLSTKYLAHSKMHESVVKLYVRKQQQHVYTRKYKEVVISGRGKATPIQFPATHPLSNFIDQPLIHLSSKQVFKMSDNY